MSVQEDISGNDISSSPNADGYAYTTTQTLGCGIDISWTNFLSAGVEGFKVKMCH
jgi:hypothetical protein